MVGVYFIEHVFSLLGGTCGHLIVGFLEFFSVQVTTAISVITPEYGRGVDKFLSLLLLRVGGKKERLVTVIGSSVFVHPPFVQIGQLAHLPFV